MEHVDMSFGESIGVGIALAMDCLAVATAAGIAERQLRVARMTLMVIMFGLFQSGMVWIGHFAGYLFSETFRAIDHWIAFVLLAIVGIGMIREGIHSKENKTEKRKNFLNIKVMILMAVATSIDALAVGVSMAFMRIADTYDILMPIIVIGAISSLITVLGLAIGIVLGRHISTKATIVGGVILIGIGVKILIEHICFP